MNNGNGLEGGLPVCSGLQAPAKGKYSKESAIRILKGELMMAVASVASSRDCPNLSYHDDPGAREALGSLADQSNDIYMHLSLNASKKIRDLAANAVVDYPILGSLPPIMAIIDYLNDGEGNAEEQRERLKKVFPGHFD